jgi:hypothetical protein
LSASQLDQRDLGLARCELFAQPLDVGQRAGRQQRIEPFGEHAFDAVLGGHLEQSDDRLAGLAPRQSGVELLPHPAIRRTREERVTEDQSLEGLGLALQGVDEVAVIDHPATAAERRPGASRQR